MRVPEAMPTYCCAPLKIWTLLLRQEGSWRREAAPELPRFALTTRHTPGKIRHTSFGGDRPCEHGAVECRQLYSGSFSMRTSTPTGGLVGAVMYSCAHQAEASPIRRVRNRRSVLQKPYGLLSRCRSVR